MSNEKNIAELEESLKSFDLSKRAAALGQLSKMLSSGEVAAKSTGATVNLHCHTFFSYNGYGMSPASVAWWMRRGGGSSRRGWSTSTSWTEWRSF